MMITVPEAAKRVNQVPATLYAAIRNGALKAQNKYGLLLVSEAELARYQPKKRGRPLLPPRALPTDVPQSELARRMGISRQRVHQLLNLEAHRARHAVIRALKKGDLVRPRQCLRCQKEGRLEAHHPDYAKPLDVLWLCPPCHTLVHPHHASIRGEPDRALRAYVKKETGMDLVTVASAKKNGNRGKK